jgi:hypothetical protein
MSPQKPWIGLALVFAAFSPALVSSFHFDDYYMLADPVVTSPSGWWEVFRLERTRPLTYLTFWGNYAIGGERPFDYHLVNLLLHLAAALLAWQVFHRVLPAAAAIAGAAVFALHPLQTEPVAYVFARATLFTTLLCLLCWRAWIDQKYWTATVYFAAALLAKEEAAAFPVFLVGFEYFHRGDTRLLRARWRAPFVAMMLAGVAVAARLFHAAAVTKGSGAAFDLGTITATTYLLTQGRAFWEYIRLLVLPWGQNFDRDFPLSNSLDFTTLAAWTAAAGVAGLCLLFVRKQPHLFWLLGGLILLAPASSIVPLADLMAERRLYLPMVSFAAGIGMLLAGLDSALRSRFLSRSHGPAEPWVAGGLGVLSIAVVVALSALTWQRSQVWRSEESLWRDTVAKSPRKVRPKLQLARALAALGPAHETEQLRLLEEAARLAPRDPDVRTERGVYFLEHGDPQRAIEEFQTALEEGAEEPQAMANRGAALYMLGRIGEAVRDFEAALARDRCNFDARNNLMLARRAAGDAEAARQLAVAPEGCRFSKKQQLALEAARP